MPDAGDRAYAHSKACGIIGKSFVGKRISSLAKLNTLSEFDRLVFPETAKDLPGRELLLDLENRIVKRAVRQILSIVNSYQKPPELLIRQLRSYEYSDLKTCLHYIEGGKKEPPVLCDIGSFRTIRFEAFPDLAAMVAGTEFEHALKPFQNPLDFAAIETEIDNLYYRGIMESLRHLSGEDRSMAQRIIAEEISIRNCIWALRLRTYYNKSEAETGRYLMDIKIRADAAGVHDDFYRLWKDNFNRREISLAAEAAESLDFHLDTRSHWHGWRWEKFLNVEHPGEHWILDPRYFQNAASEYLYRLALRCFHRMPMSVSMAFCFIRLKQFEEDLLASIVEGLGLGLPCGDVLELLEVSP